MDVRAAVAFEAGKPLTIQTVQLEGPKAGEVLVEIKASGYAIPMHIPCLVKILKVCSRRFWDMREQALS
jgi:hypothetical protein